MCNADIYPMANFQGWCAWELLGSNGERKIVMQYDSPLRKLGDLRCPTEDEHLLWCSFIKDNSNTCDCLHERLWLKSKENLYADCEVDPQLAIFER